MEFIRIQTTIFLRHLQDSPRAFKYLSMIDMTRYGLQKHFFNASQLYIRTIRDEIINYINATWTWISSITQMDGLTNEK